MASVRASFTALIAVVSLTAAEQGGELPPTPVTRLELDCQSNPNVVRFADDLDNPNPQIVEVTDQSGLRANVAVEAGHFATRDSFVSFQAGEVIASLGDMSLIAGTPDLNGNFRHGDNSATAVCDGRLPLYRGGGEDIR